jgi:hypothetical protein
MKEMVCLDGKNSAKNKHILRTEQNRTATRIPQKGHLKHHKNTYNLK